MRIQAYALAALIAAGCSSIRSTAPSAPPTPPPAPDDAADATPYTPPHEMVIDIIPKALSAETNQDSEPFLAVDLSNGKRMVATAFTPNPAGGDLAPVFVSRNGGSTWELHAVVPGGVPDTGTVDITVANTGAPSRVYAASLGLGNAPAGVEPPLIYRTSRTDDFLALAAMRQIAIRNDVDQPFVVASRDGDDLVYIGGNDFDVDDGRTATIDITTDGGHTFRKVRVETRDTLGQDGPSVRPSRSRDGTLYAAYFRWKRQGTGNLIVADVVVVADRHGATGATPFRDLTDPGDGQPGRLVKKDVTIPWSNAATLGQERIGSTLSLAVDPNDSQKVYVGWGDRAGSDIYTIHVRRSSDGGRTWSGDKLTLHNATCISLAVADSGTLGLLYQQLAGGRWKTHLLQSRDALATTSHRADVILADVPGNVPKRQFLPYLGDYNYLIPTANEFRGIFSASNVPDPANFPQGVKFQRVANTTTKTLGDGHGGTVDPSIDPFYFHVPVLQ